MQQGDQLALVAEDSEETDRIHRQDGFVVVELHGDIDILTSHHMTPLLDSLTSEPESALVVDLSRATFCDCAGLGLLARASRRAGERGGRMGLVCTHPMILRILALTGLGKALPPTATVEQAIARLSAAAEQG